MTTESILSMAWSVAAFVLLILVSILAWIVISPIAYALRYALRVLGMPEALTSFIAWLLSLTPHRLWQMGASLITVSEADGSELRIVVDQRLRALERSLRAFREQTSQATSALVGLGASGGPVGLAQQMKELSDDVAKLGASEEPYEIADDYEKPIAAELSTRFSFFAILGLAILIVIANGSILAEAFRGLGFNTRIAGVVPAGLAIAIIYVATELGTGILLHITIAHRAKQWFMNIIASFFFVIALALIAVETIITNLIGNSQLGSDPDLTALLADQLAFSNLTFMGLIGFAIGSFNIFAGFVLHFLQDELTHLKARKSVVRDARAWNTLLTSLPEKIAGISKHLNQAQGRVDSYLDTLGGSSDRFSGAVDAVVKERNQVFSALKEANLSDWPQWLGSDEGDRRQSKWVSFGIAILTLLIVGAFVWSFGSDVDAAVDGISWELALGGAVGAAIAFYLLGFLLLSKIQLIESPHRRTTPLHVDDIERIVGALAVIAGAIAVFGISIYANGTTGIFTGALNALLASALVLLGSQWDRCWRGLFEGAIALVRFFLAIAFVVGGILIHVLGWSLIAVGKVALFVLGFLGIPTEQFLNWLGRRRPATVPRTATGSKRA